MVKNPPAMWETWVRSLGWEDYSGIDGIVFFYRRIGMEKLDCKCNRDVEPSNSFSRASLFIGVTQ